MASSSLVSRASSTTRETSAASATRTMTAGWCSIPPYKTARASSYLASSGVITRPLRAARSCGIEMVDCIEKLLHERERERPPELVGCKGLELLRHVRCGFSHQRTAAGRLGVSADVSVAAWSVWPRVLVARSAMRAAARRKMLPASSARWKPATSACGGAVADRHEDHPGEQVGEVGPVDGDPREPVDAAGGEQRAGDDHRSRSDAGQQLGGNAGGDHGREGQRQVGDAGLDR